MYSTTQSGFIYVIPASGSLSIDQSLNNVKMYPVNDLSYADVSGSLQLNVGVGLFKIDNTINSDTSQFVNDSITVTAQNIIGNLISVQSVGYLADIYTNYNNYVNAYFGNTSGFSVSFTTDMSGAGKTYNNGKVNTTLTPSNAAALLNDLSGSITVSGLTELLRYICLVDPFKNRADYALYEYTNGFVVNDLIYFKSGINITLKTQIDNSGILIYSQNISSFQAIENSFNTGAVVDASGNYLVTYTDTNLASTELITSSSPAPDNVGFNHLGYTYNTGPPVYNNKILQMSVNIPLLLSLQTPPPTVALPSVQKNVSLVRYYPFDKEMGDYSSGSINTSNALTQMGVSGVKNPPYFTLSNTKVISGSNSLQCNNLGTNAYLYTPITNSNINGYTISFWVYLPSIPTTSFSLFKIMSNSNVMYQYYLYAIAGQLRPQLNTSLGTYLSLTTNGTMLGTGWTHIVIQVNPTSVGGKNAKYYVNTIRTTYGYVPYSNAITGISIDGAINGYIDEFYYYDGILSQQEINNLYNRSVTNGSASLVRWYPFLNDMYSYINDASINDLSMVAPTTTKSYTSNTYVSIVSNLSCMRYDTGPTVVYPNLYNSSSSYNYGNPINNLNKYPLTVIPNSNKNGYSFSFWVSNDVSTLTPEPNTNIYTGTILQANTTNNYPNLNTLYSFEIVDGGGGQQYFGVNMLNIFNSTTLTNIYLCAINPYDPLLRFGWIHYTVTITTAGNMIIYVNGSVAANVTSSKYYNPNISGIQYFCGFNNYSNSKPMGGNLADFYYFDGILTNQQVWSLYTKASTISALIGSGTYSLLALPH